MSRGRDGLGPKCPVTKKMKLSHSLIAVGTVGLRDALCLRHSY